MTTDVLNLFACAGGETSLSLRFAGAAVRTVEAAAFAAPTVLCGLLLTGIMRYFLGHAGTRRLFGSDTWRSLPQSWLIGMLIPVCSIGVLPALREMRRAGVERGAILAFALSAPLFNPVSILYGMTLSHPFVVLVFAFCSLMLVTVIGLVWGKLFAGASDSQTEGTMPPVGWRRIAAVILVCARDAVSGSALYWLAALLGVGLLAFALPFGALQYTMYHHDWRSPLMMTAAAPFMFVTPTAAMGQMGSMFDHGNSVGAALVLLTVGAGVNLGTAMWLWRAYGWRAFMGWFLLFFSVVVVMAYVVERPLYDGGAKGPADHTHAFDMYCNPFQESSVDLRTMAKYKLTADVARHEWQALIAVIGLTVIGLLLRILDRFVVVEEWLARAPATEGSPKGRFDVVLPNAVLAGASIVGLVAFGVLACYVYYPHPNETFETMSMVQASALVDARQKKEEEAERWILYYDDLVRKVEAGATIRGWQVDAEARKLGLHLRQELDDLRHAVEDDPEDEVAEHIKRCMAAHRAFREKYRNLPRTTWAALFPDPKKE